MQPGAAALGGGRATIEAPDDVIEKALEDLLVEKDELVAEMALDVAAVAVERVLARRHAFLSVVPSRECAQLHDALLQRLARQPLSAAYAWTYGRAGWAAMVISQAGRVE